MKANGNLAILKLLGEAGAGFDIVSGGELFRVLKAGADPGAVIFSGVGKTEQELEYAIEHKIKGFNCESVHELLLLNSLAARWQCPAHGRAAGQSRCGRCYASVHIYGFAQA